MMQLLGVGASRFAVGMIVGALLVCAIAERRRFEFNRHIFRAKDVVMVRRHDLDTVMHKSVFRSLTNADAQRVDRAKLSLKRDLHASEEAR